MARVRGQGRHPARLVTVDHSRPAANRGIRPSADPRAAAESATRPSTARLASRMERQERVIGRASPPSAWFIIDELSLYRQVGTATGNGRPTAQSARSHRHAHDHYPGTPGYRPRRQRQRLPHGRRRRVDRACGRRFRLHREGHLSGLALRFDTLRGECYRVSESVALLERLEGIWKAGANPLTPTATAETA